MKLFKYSGYQLTISEEAMLLKPFKKLWERDKTKYKEKALQELGYIYFMCDARSDYQTYIDLDERATQVKLGEGINANWVPDKYVLEAMEFYSSFKSESALLLEDIRASIKILRTGLITQEDLTDVDIEKRPKILDAYTNVVSKLTKLVKEVDEAEKTLAKELMQSDKVRGNSEKSILEDM